MKNQSKRKVEQQINHQTTTLDNKTIMYSGVPGSK